MNWKTYSEFSGSHAVLSPSKHHWVNYSEEKMKRVYLTHKKAAEGTALHDLASRLIVHNQRLEDVPLAINMFVNDAIGFRMQSELLLYSSPHCYGTVDAISFYDGVLRIHDLKTGKSRAHVNQLLVYAALFILDYEVNPSEIKAIHLRIYQEDQTIEYDPEIDEVYAICDKIRQFEQLLTHIDNT